MRWPGVEPGSIAWKATMLTVTPPTLHTETRHGRIKLCSVLHNIDDIKATVGTWYCTLVGRATLYMYVEITDL